MGFLNFLGKKEQKSAHVEEDIPPPPAPEAKEKVSSMEVPVLDEGIRPMPEFKNFGEPGSDDIWLPEISELEPEESNIPKFEEGPFFKEEEKVLKFEEPEAEIKKEREGPQNIKLMDFEEPEAPEPKLGDEIVPEELPPIKKGPEIKIKEFIGGEPHEEISPAYIHPEGPVFVRAVNLRRVLEEINAANNQLRKIPAQLKRIEEEERLFEELRAGLEGMYRKLNAIDRTLYLVNR